MKTLFFTCTALCFAFLTQAQNAVSGSRTKGAFPIVNTGFETPILLDAAEDSLIHKTAALFRNDLLLVTGKAPRITYAPAPSKSIILIGTVQSGLIQQLVQEKKLRLDSIRDKWEAFHIQVVNSPFKGVEQALVIAGSDRRGAAYGVLELSRQIGVSPWYWWADVPVAKKKELFLKGDLVLTDAPKVKYRGIFINDEAPALSGWAHQNFGGFNHHFYEKVFELMLRLKANYLWPAMWGNAFYDDDSSNRLAAHNYGIVIGTSHHEPLMRAHDEWRRYGTGKWNYDSNATRLRQFWKEGLQRATNEKIVSIGMRGDGDEPMTEGTAIALLERIVKDQRGIISDVTGKSPDQTPQLWALYKEVQDYYDRGMRVPDDVTLLLCDDNWGNIRKLPRLTDKPRKGGYGIYYHFDYVGGPRNYKWLNTNNIARVWEQMHLAWEYDARQIWIVNVGDIKPMELPTSFFLDYAWNPHQWNEDNLRTYYTRWAKDQFGVRYASQIGQVLRKYAQFSSRRKPELLDADTYSFNYGEADRVLKEWTDLLNDAERIGQQLPQQYKDAFFQLVLHPVKALSNLHQLYVAVAKNRVHFQKDAAEAERWANKAKQHYLEDSLITLQYHNLNGRKWNHMMSQTHIGYTYWQQPPQNKMPELNVAPSPAHSYPPFSNNPGPTAEQLIPKRKSGNLFYEKEGYVSMEAEYWTRKKDGNGLQWKVVPDVGRTGSGVSTFPVTLSPSLDLSGPWLEYEFYSYDSGSLVLQSYFSPRLGFHRGEPVRYAVSIDGEAPQVIELNSNEDSLPVWENWVANNSAVRPSKHLIKSPGRHVLRFWSLSPAVILQKLVIDFGSLKPSYLGPPETRFK